MLQDWAGTTIAAIMAAALATTFRARLKYRTHISPPLCANRNLST
jgi:hypothetical protein